MTSPSYFILSIVLATFTVPGDSRLTVKDIMSKNPKRPPLQNGKPLNVSLGMYLESLGNFKETDMSFDVDLYMYMSWRDVTLKHNESEYVMVNDDDIRKAIWLPDLYFANARNARFHSVTVPNFNIFVAQDGTVAYSCRVTLTVACNLDLENYPMDHQTCYIRVLSYAYIASVVRVSWFSEEPIRYNQEINLPEFQISNVSGTYCDGTYRYAITANSYKVDKFSCLMGNIHLGRSIGFNMVQSYIPTGLIVIISWVSFWIDRRAVPARVTLSFTTLVSLTTIGNGLRYGLPQVSYAKAIDFWFGACMLFVFCALIEFAVVNSYMRTSEKYERLAKKAVFTDMEGESPKQSASYYTATKEEKNSANNECMDNMKANEHMVASVYENVSANETLNYCLDLKDISSDEESSTEYRASSIKQEMERRAASGSSNQLIADQYNQMAIKCSRKGLKIDKGCRYIFPSLFIIWNILYWCYYIVAQKSR